MTIATADRYARIRCRDHQGSCSSRSPELPGSSGRLGECVVRFPPESARGGNLVRGRGAHVEIDPAILHSGTPVVLLSTLDEDGATNLMPMRWPEPVEGSLVFWLGRTAVLGIGASSQSGRNLRERPEIVLDLPPVDLVTQVDRLALTTGNGAMSAAKA